MARDHLATTREALDTLIAVRRDLAPKVARAGHRENIWQEFREVQATIEALARALTDEEERNGHDTGKSAGQK